MVEVVSALALTRLTMNSRNIKVVRTQFKNLVFRAVIILVCTQERNVQASFATIRFVHLAGTVFLERPAAGFGVLLI